MTSRITFLGSESTGKTTLSYEMYKIYGDTSVWTYEFARPYLEKFGARELRHSDMHIIWKAQAVLQDMADLTGAGDYIFQDTDLFATLGYWRFWDPHWNAKSLAEDAVARKSDFYFITQSNIPFESDPLRYGGDKRELNDRLWVNLCEEFNLPFHVIQSSTLEERIAEVEDKIEELEL